MGRPRGEEGTGIRRKHGLWRGSTASGFISADTMTGSPLQ